MLILHAAASKEFEGVSLIWAEAEAKDRSQQKGRSPWKWTAGAREHPYHASRDRLRAVLPEEVLALEEWQWMTAWLPSDAAGPIPSNHPITARSGRRGERLAPWAVHTLMIGAGTLHDWFLDYRGKVATEWQCGGDVAFWRQVQEWAAWLVVRQRFLPGVVEVGGYWFANWRPMYDCEDWPQMERLAEAMPLAARALNQHPRRLPADTPHRSLHSTIDRFVDRLVRRAVDWYEVWASRPTGGGRKTRPVQERWVEALLLPGAEMRGQGEELVELAVQIARWGEPLDRRPKREFGDHAPPISLPAGGVGFWEGRPLPKASPCPEIPRRPAGILERLGGFPDWPGDQPLRDWLAPVYEAASRYALEHAFGRKV